MPVKALFRRIKKQSNSFAVPPGRRVYAVGDIHGRLDLLDDLLAQIDAEEARRAAADTEIVFLGDLVDRGPDSRGVVDRLLTLSRERSGLRFLLGNHEEIFLKAVRGDRKALRLFDRIGGRETMASYGIDESRYRSMDFDALAEETARVVDPSHVAFLEGFEHWIAIGDYLFVHAGIRPGVPIELQSVTDLCWIRDEFLNCRDDFGCMVVHGHTITREVDARHNRLGIDTGAYSSGRLTCVVLEGRERSFLTT